MIGATAGAHSRDTNDQMAARYEYKVLELREKLNGGKLSGDKLAKVLNDHAAEGLRLKALTRAGAISSTSSSPTGP